jgi:hypothetical protein
MSSDQTSDFKEPLNPDIIEEMNPSYYTARKWIHHPPWNAKSAITMLSEARYTYSALAMNDEEGEMQKP